MKPFPQSNFTSEKKKINYKSTRSRWISENAFKPEKVKTLKPEKVKIILNNWLRSELCTGKIYIPQSLIGSEDTSHNVLPGIWRSDEPIESWFDLTPTRSKHSSNQANAGRQ